MTESLELKLRGALQRMQSFRGEDIKVAEAEITFLSNEIEFIKTLLTILSSEDVNRQDFGTGQAAAIILKNCIMRTWDIDVSQGGMRDADRQLIRTELLKVSLSAPRMIQLQLQYILELIAETDFPHKWPELLDELINNHLGSDNPQVQIRAMKSLHKLVKKYRQAERSNDILSELKIILEKLQQPLYEIFQLSQKVVFERQHPSHGDDLKIALNALLYSCKIFHSLNRIDLPEFYEDHITSYFHGWARFLRFSHPDAVGDGEYTKGPLQKIWAEICTILQVYSDKYQEEFDQVVGPCLIAVRDLLNSTSNAPCNDQVVSSGMNFLSSAARTLWKQSNPFTDPNFIQSLCDGCIVQNAQLRDADVEMMQERPLEYLRKDCEIYEHETRRQSAMNLIKAMGMHYESQVTSCLMAHINRLLQEGTTAHTSSYLIMERRKDTAAYLISALAIKAQSRFQGVTRINENVNIIEFFSTALFPCLMTRDINDNTIEKISAMKFIVTFRNQFERNVLTDLLNPVASHLVSNSPSVSSYAAHCIERMLSCRVAPPLPAGVQSYGPVTSWSYKIERLVIQEKLLQVVSPLLSLITNYDKSHIENEFAMKCIMRIFFFLKIDAAAPILEPTLNMLLSLVDKFADNPSNAMFSHYLFDSIALLTNMIFGRFPLNSAIEQRILQAIDFTLRREMHDYVPYALQLLGVLLDSSSIAVSDKSLYETIYHSLLDFQRWTISTGNVPALISVLSAYFRKYNTFQSVISPTIKTVFERFQYCVFHQRLVSNAFDFLNDIIEHIPVSEYSDLIEPLMKCILQKVNQNRTETISRKMTFTFSYLACKTSSVVYLPEVLNRVQHGLANSFFMNFYLPSVGLLKQTSEKKICVLNLSHLCTTKEFLDNSELLNETIKKIVALITNDQLLSGQSLTADKTKEAEETDMTDAFYASEFQGSFNKLAAVNPTPGDRAIPVENIETVIYGFLKSPQFTEKAKALPSYPSLCPIISV